MIRIILLASLILIGMSFAQGISINIPSSESVNEKLKILKEMGQKSGMEEAQKQRYDQLWAHANKVAQMNDRCASISLNDILDQDCQQFYEIELPKFDREFFEITGDFRLNSVKTVQSLDDKKALINACIAALDVDAYKPSQVMRLSGDISPEPLDDNMTMVKYTLSMNFDDISKNAISEQLTKWFQSCEPGIISQGEFTPYFLQKISKMEAGKNGYFSADDKSLKYILNQDFPFSYYVNNRFLFAQSYHRDQVLLNISSEGEITFLPFPEMTWKDNRIFSETEVKEKGVSGKLFWGKRLAPKRKLQKLANQVVKTVDIGKQEWTMDMGKTSWQNAQNVCPDGWRLPSDQDWIAMGNFVKDNNHGHSIAASLMSARGWNAGGSDLFGFSARPQSYSPSSKASCSGNCAKFWSTTEVDGNSASAWVMMDDKLKLVPHQKSASLTVRCIKATKLK